MASLAATSAVTPWSTSDCREGVFSINTEPTDRRPDAPNSNRAFCTRMVIAQEGLFIRISQGYRNKRAGGHAARV